MATNQATTGKNVSKSGRPILGLKTPAAKKANVEDHSPRVEDQPREVVYATENDLVNGLVTAFAHHRDALNYELAASLIYLASQKASAHPGTKVGKAVQDGLRGLYVKAGYDCAKTDGEDYKTVQRRIGYAIGLYQKEGGEETVSDQIADCRPRVQVGELAKYLAERHKFSGMSAVAQYIGKVGPKETRAPKLGDHKGEKQGDKPQAQAEEGSEQAEASAEVPKAQLSDQAAQPRAGHEGTDGVKADSKQEVNGGTAAEELTEEEKAALAETDEEAKSRQEAEAKKGGRRANDNLPPERILQFGALRLAIPFEATIDDMKAMAMALVEFAATVKAQQNVGQAH
jgi:hypothetical protein